MTGDLGSQEFPLLEEHARTKVRDAMWLVSQAMALRQQLSVKELLRPLMTQVQYSKCLVADTLGSWPGGDESHFLPRFFFQRTAIKKQRIKVGLFAGIHGDEPAGILGLMDFVCELDEDPELGRAFELSIYPLCNPTG